MHVKTETWRQLRFISLDYREISGQYWKVTWRVSWKVSGNPCRLLFWGTLTLPSDCIPFSSSAVTSAAEPGGSEEGVLWWTQWLSLQKRPTKTCLLLHLHKGSVSRYQLWVRECAPSFHTSASGALILDFCCSQVTKFMALEQMKETGKESGAHLRKSLERILCYISRKCLTYLKPKQSLEVLSL